MDAAVLEDGKGAFRERSIAVGQQAALKKQLNELQRSHQDLIKRFEARDQKCDELRSKFTAAKAALSARERELDTAQRLLQKSTAEKNQIKEESAERQVYTRRLEAKLEELQGAADLASKYHAAKQQVLEQQQQLTAVTAELHTARELAEQQQREVERLNRALDIRISELSQEFGGSEDVPAQLLNSLAESREESLLLAKQLATTKAELQKQKTASSKLSTKLESEQLLRTDAEQAAEQLKQRLEKLLEGSKEANKQRTDLAQQLASAQSDAAALKAERDELAEVVLEMQEELEQLKADAARTAAASHDASAAATMQLRQQLEQSQAAAAAAAKEQERRADQLSQRCAQLVEQATQLEAALQQQVLAAQQTAAARQQQILVLESQLQNRRQRELELEQQVTELQARLAQLTGAVNSAEAASKQSGHLERQVARLEAALRVASVEKQQLQQRLQQELEEAATVQQEAAREADGLRVQLAAKDVMQRCLQQETAQLQGQLQDANQQVQELMQELQETQAAKADLQQAMRKQVGDFKEKLQQLQQTHKPHSSRSRSPPLPHKTSWQAAPRSPGQLLSAPNPALAHGSSGAEHVHKRKSRSQPSRSAGVGSSQASAPWYGSSPTKANDWGALSAAGYVSEPAAAAIDAARRGKILAAARRLPQPKAAKSMPLPAAAAASSVGSLVDGSLASKASQRHSQDSHKAAKVAAAALATALEQKTSSITTSSSTRPTLRTSLDLQLLGIHQQPHRHSSASILSQPQHKQAAAESPSKAADRTGRRPRRSLSCDLTAAAAALDAEVSAVLATASPRHRSPPTPGSQLPFMQQAKQQQQQHWLWHPATSGSSSHDSLDAPSPAGVAPASGVGAVPHCHSATVSPHSDAAAYAVGSLASPRDQDSKHSSKQPSPRAGVTAAAAGGAGWNGANLLPDSRAAAFGDNIARRSSSRPSPSMPSGGNNSCVGSRARSPSCFDRQAATQQQEHQSSWHDFGSSCCSPRSAGPTPRARSGGREDAVVDGSCGDPRHLAAVLQQQLSGPVEPCSPTLVAAHGMQSQVDPYSLPASTQPSFRAQHSERQQQCREQSSPQPHAFSAGDCDLGAQPAAHHVGGDARRQPDTALSRHGGAGSPAPNEQQQAAVQQQQAHNQWQQQHQPHRGVHAEEDFLSQHSGASHNNPLYQNSSYSSAAGSKHSHSNSSVEELGAWEVPQFGSQSSGGESDDSASLDLQPHVDATAAAAALVTEGLVEGAGAVVCSGTGRQSPHLQPQLTDSARSSNSGSSSHSSSSSRSGRSRAQPPAVPRPSGAGAGAAARRSRQHASGSATGLALDAASRAASDGSGHMSSCGTTPRSRGGVQQHAPPAAGLSVGSCGSRRVSEGGSSSGSSSGSSRHELPRRSIHRTDAAVHGATVVGGAADAAVTQPCRTAGSPPATINATAAAVAADASVGRGDMQEGAVEQSPWLPDGFRTCAELLSPPSTGKAFRGSSRGSASGSSRGGAEGSSRGGAGPPLSRLGHLLSEDTLAGVHDAPDDSWLMPYEPHQQQQEQQVQPPLRDPARRSSSSRLSAVPSLSSWQAPTTAAAATGGARPEPQHKPTGNGAGSRHGSSAAAPTGQFHGAEGRSSHSVNRASAGGGGGGGQGSNRIEFLLDEWEQGAVPSLQDLADM